jgi:hypothetical protein
MRSLARWIAATFLLLVRLCAGQEPSSFRPPANANESELDEEWRVALLAMREVDQALRHQMMADLATPEQVLAVDLRHTHVVRLLLAQHGWPGRDLVGRDGAQATWLLVQHADHDVQFQANCLKLLRAAVESGDASREHLALLTDRVLVGQGKPQLYGTQFMLAGDGKYVPRPIEDPARVDVRRGAMDLPPLAEYERRMNEIYRPASKPPTR